jgi:large subunit ribosomal protein L22
MTLNSPDTQSVPIGYKVRAKARYLPISAQKIRLVCDQVRGKDVEEALTILQFMPQKGAKFVYKALRSAIANAEENYEMNRLDLFVAEIYADEGPSRNWRRFGARGRFKPIIRRTAHLTVVVQEHEEA